MKGQKGFTLIELMIVVAIIGILASVAVPQYQDYVARTKVADAFSTAAAAKTLLAEFYNSEGVMPVSCSNPFLTIPSKCCSPDLARCRCTVRAK